MRKILGIVLILVIAFGTLFAGGQGENAEGKSKLVFTSWRTEDIERMNRINKVFMAQNPDITVEFQPIKDTEYDAQLKSSLVSGVAADIIFLRSYDSGMQIWDTGKLLPLNDVLSSLADFPSSARNAWSTPDGVTYAVPFVGVTHGVYYNKAVFAEYGLKPPKTWNEFISVCETLKAGGETVFAQGTKDGWHLYEVVFSGLGANFYGGEEARQELMAGKAKLTDPNFVKAFEKINELKPYFPDDYQAIDYVSMQQLFGTGQAAMFIGGSWEIGIFEDLGSGENEIGYFPPPVEKAGDQLSYCFHVDAGIGVNKESENLEAAKTYIEWCATPEFAQLFMEELPGFFAYTPGDYTLSNSLANANLAPVANADVTVRTVWEKMSAQDPSGNVLMWEALIAMYNGIMTPAEAAAHVQRGLDTWYKP
ncbi:extracellular solute-binding protein [Marispirochaeta sp.]|uniref:ABC transporter substrate-binding protein n=1 Tax=Marispirochaeta sp. TaxID=2038653 RepID=UPI0029C833E0|nr:extracellular solute-binding protein [Marispirochaeta sp.]